MLECGMVFPPTKQQIQSFWEKRMLGEMCTLQVTCFSTARIRLHGVSFLPPRKLQWSKYTQCYLDVSYQGSSPAAPRAALASVQFLFQEFCSVYRVSARLPMVVTQFFRIVLG